MKRKLLILFILCVNIIFCNNFVYAEADEIMQEQQESFGISSFIKEGDFFEDINIQNMFNEAVTGQINNDTIFKRVLNFFGKELIDSLKALAAILAVIIIHSILKSISDSLDSSSVSQIIYYVQYILIVTIIMANFSDIIQMVKDTADNLVGFMNSLVPLLIALMMYTGSIVTSGVIEPIILFMINIIGNLINMVLIPVVLIITVLSIISKISDRIQISKLSKFLNSSVVWFLGIVLKLFVATISIEGTLSSSVDGITAKTAKAAVSNVIPVVGKILRRCC